MISGLALPQLKYYVCVSVCVGGGGGGGCNLEPEPRQLY